MSHMGHTGFIGSTGFIGFSGFINFTDFVGFTLDAKSNRQTHAMSGP